MRVALVTSSYAPYVGGVEEHVRNVATLLRERGHDVVVWTVARDGRFGMRDVDAVQVLDLPAPLPARSISALLAFGLRMPGAALRWWKAMRTFRPDIVHVHCFGPNGTYGRILARRAHVPLVITSHGETLADDHAVFTDSRLAIASLRRGLSQAAAVTACSEVTLDDLVRRFGLSRGRGSVVFNGIDLDEPVGDPPRGANGRLIAAIGRVERLKGFDLLLSAFERAQLPDDVRLVIGGGGPELEKLKTQAKQLGVAHRVTFTGWLERAAVGGLRRSALIGVVPSRLEPFGIAALEVWRAGSALVATTRGGPPEFVDDGVDGILVDPENVDELAQVLTNLVADPARSAALAAAGRARVSGFTWGRTVDQYETIYRRLGRASERSELAVRGRAGSRRIAGR